MVLADPVLVVELTGDEPPEASAAVAQLMARLVGDVVVCTPRAVALDGVTPGPTVDRSTRAEQRALWRELLPGRAEAAAAVLAREFDLGHREILDSATPAVPGPTVDPVALARGLVRERVRRDLDGLAERIDVRAGWGDLVLPAAALAQLRQLTAAAAGLDPESLRTDGLPTVVGDLARLVAVGLKLLFLSRTGLSLFTDEVTVDEFDLHDAQ